MKFREGKLSLRLFVILALLGIITGCAPAGDSSAMPRAEQGVLDLANWRWKQDGVVPLNGNWRFEWLNDSSAGQAGHSERTLAVPGTWGTTLTSDGTALSDKGMAVYRLDLRHLPVDRQMAIRIPNVSTAYQFYLNGKLTASRGAVGLDAASSTPYQTPATVFFDPVGENTELALFVSNFDHRRGGIRTALVIGEEEQIKNLRLKRVGQELIVFGCLIMIGFYHLGLYILRRKEQANIFFALLCLFVALRMGLIGEGFLVQWIPEFTWTLAIRIEYVAFVLSGWAGLGYFHRMYPEEFKRGRVRIASACAGLLVLLTFVVQPIVFTSWIIAYQFFILVISLLILVSLLLSVSRQREGAKLAIVGVAGFVLTIVNDMLFYNGWWSSVDLVPFGLLFLIIMNSFIISLRFSQTYERVEQMSAELMDWNNSLELKIAERTEELQRSYATVEHAKSELERMENSRRQLVSNISHDLRTPITLLQGYLEALRDQVISDEEQRNATIRLMLTKVEGLNSLIQDLFEISVLEARKVELIRERLALAHWRDNLLEQYGLELEQRGIRFDCKLDDSADASLEVTIDLQRMNRVFANLIYNATRYTPKGGSIEIAIAADTASGSVKLAVTDNGEGINSDDLPYIFDRFYKKDKSRHSRSGGSGLGLAIVKEIVELHGGTIRAYNVQPCGCTFEITLPLAGNDARYAG